MAPTSLALFAALLVLLVAPSARAGAVFEVREAVPSDPDDLKFVFGSPANQVQDFPGAGSIRRSGGAGAGLFFNSSAIPLAQFTLNKCAAVAVHIHPNAAEQLFVTEGRIKIYQFRGEEDGTAVRTVTLGVGEAGYIQQGAYHFVENVSRGTSKFLQIFDHPQGGAVFAAPALVALRNAGGNAAKIVNAGFTGLDFNANVGANGAIVKFDCHY